MNILKQFKNKNTFTQMMAICNGEGGDDCRHQDIG